MTPEFDDILLTAYLDDEVTEAERKKVEEQLRTSAASRRLLEELRSVRSLVTQLHMTQSARSYQQGPWNQSNSVSQDSSPASDRSHVTLHDPRSRSKLPFQRLASIAALIAIVVCGRILFLQPNKPALSLSDGTRTSTDRDLESRREIRPTLEMEDFVLSDNAVPASGLGGVRSLAEPANRDISESDVAPEGLIAYPSKDTLSLAVNPADQKEHYFFDDLLRDQSQEWKRQVVQEVEPVTQHYFRYRNVNQLGRVIDDSTALLRKSTATKEPESDAFEKQPAEKQKRMAEHPLLVEFEIPRNEWESGAKRLRQLGISVPLELPEVEFLEFTGVPISSEAKTRATESVSDFSANRPELELRAAGSQELSRWTFQPTDPMEAQRSVQQLAQKEAALSKNGGSLMEQPSSIRIRVRAISTTEE